MTTSPRHLLARLASLGLLAATAIVLMADSADTDCTKGHTSARYRGRYTSTCPESFAAKAGEVTIDIPSSGEAGRPDIQDALRRGGLPGGGVDTDSAETCTPLVFVVSDRSNVRCEKVPFDAARTVVTCEPRSYATGLSLGIGRRDMSDAAPRDPVDASADADAPRDASADGDADASPPLSTTEPSPAPATPDFPCTITFERLP